ncbi:hypothetical protein CYLTODRAFT_368649 [Cylindrobasidium torrendii FP15055 ss-10]|uniref:Alcohol dehydrogenase-like N-terminal domain-containing protein n=1 Tax=Cylindrobasidium torrendii FP15055 ss-10 TaxID=1314674 RepID=A0A0D7BNL9_9AGAR|nr:hypothetical protein CYLTODRAFT_368649 [Cylindrobasidium torrendii FP15055 ss-10]
MAKPTILQTLLGQPSQSYARGPEKHYYSSKAHLIRLAAENDNIQSGETTRAPTPDDDEPTVDQCEGPHASTSQPVSRPPPSILLPDEEESDDSSATDAFYTPSSSPRVSMAPTTEISYQVMTPSADKVENWDTSSASVSSISIDTHSIFSSESTPSTAITSPVSSEAGGHTRRGSPSPKHHVDTQPQTVPSRQNTVRGSHTPARPTRTPSARTMPSSSTSKRTPPVSRASSPPPSRSRKLDRPVPSITMSMNAMMAMENNRNSNYYRPPRPRFPSSPPTSARSSAYGHMRQQSAPLASSAAYDISSLPTSAPYHPSIPSAGTPGYTSLTLPRAPPPAFARPTASDHGHGSRLLGFGSGDAVDLTKSGIAQTTMASVEIVRGLGASKHFFSRRSSRTKDTLGFTSYRAPPSSIPSGGVLVQVWAAGVDGTDVRRAAQESTGFVPGRSFAGRVLECGWEVKDEVIRKGDWVIGLLDVRKSGALQEFIVADRHRVHRVPPPTQENSIPLETLALLPLCGVAAYRAVRTFVVAFGADSVVPLPDGTMSRFGNDHDPGMARRALILNGHEGIGAIAVQMLTGRGWRVSVHAPMLDVFDEDTYMREVEERVRQWGGEEVVFDDGDGPGAALRVLERLAGDGDAFDAILDTIGGKEIWEASQKLIGGGKKGTRGQFTTLVGDAPEKTVPSATANFRAGIRALKNTHNQEGVKVGYAWVSIAQDVDWEGEDVGNTLGAVLRLGVIPRALEAERIVPFERAPNVFSGPLLEHGGTAVVKVVS